MKIIFWKTVFFLSVFILPPNLLGQEAHNSSTTYKWFDGKVGVKNTDLYNGIEYIEQHITVNKKQKFLGSTYFTPGRVVYYGQPYYDIEMKYNVYDDLLLLRGNGSKLLQLHKSQVREFSLYDHHFINITDDASAAVQGFYEVLLETEELKLLKKHTKKRKKFLDRSFVYFEFYEDDPQYAIAIEGEYHPLNSRREIIRAFPDHARELRQFYRKERKKSGSNPDLFMIELAKKLTHLSSSNTLME